MAEMTAMDEFTKGFKTFNTIIDIVKKMTNWEEDLCVEFGGLLWAQLVEADIIKVEDLEGQAEIAMQLMGEM